MPMGETAMEEGGWFYSLIIVNRYREFLGMKS
jgi:hypothetical protein